MYYRIPFILGISTLHSKNAVIPGTIIQWRMTGDSVIDVELVCAHE